VWSGRGKAGTVCRHHEHEQPGQRANRDGRRDGGQEPEGHRRARHKKPEVANRDALTELARWGARTFPVRMCIAGRER